MMKPDSTFNPLIDGQLETLLPLDLSKISLQSDTFDLGHLQRLPKELLLLVLEELPLVSLICFRNTNPLAHHVVDTMHKFRIIVEQAPQAIRGVLAVQTKVRTALPELYEKLRQHCDSCGKFAQHFWLPTASRLCFHCARFGRYYFRKTELKGVYQLSDEDIKSVPSFRLLRVIIRAGGGRRVQLFEEHTLYDAEVAARLYFNKTSLWILLRMEQIYACGSCESVCCFDDPSNQQRRIKASHGFVLLSQCRDMAMITAPWISSHGAMTGVFCKLCYSTNEQCSLYTPAGFLEHLQQCRVQPLSSYAMTQQRSVMAKYAIFRLIRADEVIVE